MTANTLRQGGKDLATKADIIQYRIPLVTGDLVASARRTAQIHGMRR
ncbi:MAG: hypothetical protein ACREXX_21950 [Gammaproteobacteria bacterium]